MKEEKGRFELPGKIDQYLATLNRLYEERSESVLQEIVVNGDVSIHEVYENDNYDGDGHALTLTFSEDTYLKFMDDVHNLGDRIRQDINMLNNTHDEYIAEVFLEMKPAEHHKWRENSGVLRSRVAASSVPSDALDRIWGDGHTRVFLSHKANAKSQTSKLKEALSLFGISSFVAHDDIEPTQEWQREIEHALLSMDAFVCLLTEDFHDSFWTDQEVGVAIGRGVLLIPVRLGLDPYGFMGKGQGVSGCDWADTADMAEKIFEVLLKRLLRQTQLFEFVLSKYATSRDFVESGWNAENLLTKLQSPTKHQVKQIVDAYLDNNQNKHSFQGKRALKPLLEKWTGERWEVSGHVLMRAVDVKPEIDLS